MISGISPAVSHQSWIDRLNRSVVRLDTGFGIRWYGLAYLAGFLLIGWILLRWARKGRPPIEEVEVPTFVFYSALGVLIGGTLGYYLLYQAHNILYQPLEIFALWHGGRASHVGIAGLIIVLWAFVPQPGMSVMSLLDAGAATIPQGIANFINGELWGRPASVPWAGIFPQVPLLDGIQVRRHTSQLYAAGFEEFLVLLAAQWTYLRSSRVGLITAAVSIDYGNWTIH
jgi:phosphatidylglycerol:prolipoprotein diacylglycerol transferase